MHRGSFLEVRLTSPSSLEYFPRTRTCPSRLASSWDGRFADQAPRIFLNVFRTFRRLKTEGLFSGICSLLFPEHFDCHRFPRDFVFSPFLAFREGPGGFREVREAGRNHFHLSWYLILPGITSYDKKIGKNIRNI